MKVEATSEHHDRSPLEKSEVASRIDTLAWGLFLLWVGSTWLARVDVGVGLIGAGVIALGAQLARIVLHLALQGFWVVVGALLVLGGLSQLLAVELSLAPLALIALGLLVILGPSLRKRHASVCGSCCRPFTDDR